MAFQSTILMHPGLGNSGEQHWQTLWCKQFPEIIRIEQREWETPDCSEWIATLDEYVMQHPLDQVILVGHSLACCTIVSWARKYNRVIKGALLVAPSDTEAPSYPPGTTGFAPMPLNELPFPSIAVTSTNDFYVTLDRARYFAQAWGSELVEVGEAGHINVAAGFGPWPAGLNRLRKLDAGREI